MTEARHITQLLRRWGEGDEGAADELAPLVYDELHRRALAVFSREKPGHTLQPTALINEAYAHLAEADVTWQDRAHFYALCARMMRRLLINHANARRAQRRGGERVRVTFEDNMGQKGGEDYQMIALADALEDLRKHDEEKARLVELTYFGGLTTEEASAVTGLSVATIGRHLRFARSWLRQEMSDER